MSDPGVVATHPGVVVLAGCGVLVAIAVVVWVAFMWSRGAL